MADARTHHDFPSTDEAAWRRLVERALGGRPFEALLSHTVEGLAIEPLYRRTTTEGLRAFRQKPGAWKISQRIDHPDPTIANHMARADLDGGADALTLTIAGAPASRGFGTAIHNGADLGLALASIDLDLVPLRVDAGCHSLEIARDLRSLAHDRRVTSASLDIDLGYDPIGTFARTGVLPAHPETIARDAAALSRLLRESGFSGHLLLADGRPYNDAGAGEAQELACVLATGVAYLRLLEGNELALDEARDDIAFLLAADADAFLTLAKFRALRRLWAQIESTCDLARKPMRLHGETAFRMLTRYDPWINVLRATIATMYAAIGGADTITVLPFTLALGLPDEAARRLARNTQLVLIHEAHLAKVADPAAGSGAFEALTDELCQHAWSLFQRFEKQGGMIASLEAGLPQTLVAETAAARHAAIACRSRALTGTSTFPDLAEGPIHVLAPVCNVREEPHAAIAGTPPRLAVQRDSEPFEALRAVSDEMLARTGARPRVFVACVGSTPAQSPQAAFARDLFAAAGIEAMPWWSSDSPEEAAAGFVVSGCKIACICASAGVPTEKIVAFFDTLRAAGATSLTLVGRPSATARDAELFENVAIITDGCDIIPVLRSALAQAAVALTS